MKLFKSLFIGIAAATTCDVTELSLVDMAHFDHWDCGLPDDQTDVPKRTKCYPVCKDGYEDYCHGPNFSKCVRNSRTNNTVDWNRNPLDCKCRRDIDSLANEVDEVKKTVDDNLLTGFCTVKGKTADWQDNVPSTLGGVYVKDVDLSASTFNTYLTCDDSCWTAQGSNSVYPYTDDFYIYIYQAGITAQDAVDYNWELHYEVQSPC